MKKLALFLLFFPIFISCSNKEKSSFTNEVHTISLKVEDSNNGPYALDSLKVYMLEKEMTLIKDFKSNSFKECQTTGNYSLVNDDFDFVYEGLFIEYPILLGNITVLGYKQDKVLFEKQLAIMKDHSRLYCDVKNLTVTILD